MLWPENLDKLVVGEGAACTLFSFEPDLGTFGCVRAYANEAHGEQHRGLEPNFGAGLTSLFARIGKLWGPRRFEAVLTSHNGEAFWVKEFLQAYMRHSELFPGSDRFHHIFATHGDLGAAAPQLHLSLFALQPRSVPPPHGDSALLFAVSDDGHMGACVWERSAAGSPP